MILGSIDRTLVTSRNALTRQRSTRRLAFWSISGVTLLWLLYYVHIWFFTNIQSPAPGIVFCFFQSGIYAQLMSYSTMTISGFLPPLLMAILAFSTMKNLRHLRVHPAAHEHASTALSSKDRQLAIMLLGEIVISVVFSSIGSIIYVYTQRIPNQSKTIEQRAVDNFLLDFSLDLVFIQATVAGYSNFIISKTFRKNLRKQFWTIILNACRRTRINYFSNMPSNALDRTARAGTIHLRTVVMHE
ncbi:unnamed protein product [Rotaria sp. Silwood1]|nr:unnamed protein product [Rotaria sp. Silwood1]CAF5042172.1 unnamed protein product [Rotaria sp. Silwood1]